MRRDKIYWLYQRQALLEQFQHLDEAARKFHSYNLDYQIANNMSHSGESVDTIHEYLSNNISPSHYADAYMHWYHHGGEVPVGSYLRAVAKSTFNMRNAVKHPEIDGMPVHDSLVHPSSRSMMLRLHDRTKSVHENVLPENITVYRGVGLLKHTSGSEYKPHALESWTTDLDTARKFSDMSHLPNTIPHIFKANVHRDHVLMSHLSSHLVGFIPKESDLVGKAEHVVLGHQLKNIERVA